MKTLKIIKVLEHKALIEFDTGTRDWYDIKYVSTRDYNYVTSEGAIYGQFLPIRIINMDESSDNSFDNSFLVEFANESRSWVNKERVYELEYPGEGVK